MGASSLSVFDPSVLQVFLEFSQKSVYFELAENPVMVTTKQPSDPAGDVVVINSQFSITGTVLATDCAPYSKSQSRLGCSGLTRNPQTALDVYTWNSSSCRDSNTTLELTVVG